MNSTAAIIEQLGITTASLAARGLHEYQEAECLVVAEVGGEGKEHFLVPAAAFAWRKLKDAALADQIQVFIISGFRSIKRQEEIIRRKLNSGACVED